MTSTHLSLQYHLIFSTKERRGWIKESWQERLHSYLGGTLRGLGGVAEDVGGTEDHVYIFMIAGDTYVIRDIIRHPK